MVLRMRLSLVLSMDVKVMMLRMRFPRVLSIEMVEKVMVVQATVERLEMVAKEAQRMITNGRLKMSARTILLEEMARATGAERLTDYGTSMRPCVWPYVGRPPHFGAIFLLAPSFWPLRFRRDRSRWWG